MESSLVFEGDIFPGTKFWEEFLKLDLFEVLTWAPPACFPPLCPPRAPVWQSLLDPQPYSSAKGTLSSGSVLSLDLLALRYILGSCPQAPSEMGMHMKHRPVFAGKLVLRTLPMVCATGTGAPPLSGTLVWAKIMEQGTEQIKFGLCRAYILLGGRTTPKHVYDVRQWEALGRDGAGERQRAPV